MRELRMKSIFHVVITKIMTCLVALENGNLEDTVTVSKSAADVWGSDIKLKVGQKVKLEEMLYGLMLKSGNDAAVAIAEHVGGSEENFVKMMNEKAAELGAANTRFANPHGLDVDGHYSTAYDMAVITAYALSNQKFAAIVATKEITFDQFAFYNTNEMLGVYPNANGVKTGYTGLAGRCLVTSVTENGMTLISVVLNCSSREKRAAASKKILDYAKDKYKRRVLLKKDEDMGKIEIIKGRESSVDVRAKSDIILPLSDEEVSKMKKEIIMEPRRYAPVSRGEAAGVIRFYTDGVCIGQSDIIFTETVIDLKYGDYLRKLFDKWLLK